MHRYLGGRRFEESNWPPCGQSRCGVSTLHLSSAHVYAVKSGLLCVLSVEFIVSATYSCLGWAPGLRMRLYELIRASLFVCQGDEQHLQ